MRELCFESSCAFSSESASTFSLPCRETVQSEEDTLLVEKKKVPEGVFQDTGKFIAVPSPPTLTSMCL